MQEELENRIIEEEKRTKDLEEKLEEVEEKLGELIRRVDFHAHTGFDQTTKLYTNIELNPGSDLSIGGSSFKNYTANQSLSTEVNYTILTAGANAIGGFSPNTSANSQINFQSANSTTGATFLWGYRPPLFQNTNQSITNGGNTLQDGLFTWTTNELAGSYINIVSAAGALQETRKIASNTADTITISGTWSSATASTYTYTVWETIYMGSANHPWERFYAMSDIRFGMGTSGGADVIYIKFGSGTPESAVTANVGSLYMRTDGGAGTTLYVKESGTGNIGWSGL